MSSAATPIPGGLQLWLPELGVQYSPVVLVGKTDPSRWDYGVPAARLKYSANASQTSGQSTSAYANADLMVNLGRWVLASNMSASRYADGSGEFTARDITLSTAISQVQGTCCSVNPRPAAPCSLISAFTGRHCAPTVTCCRGRPAGMPRLSPGWRTPPPASPSARTGTPCTQSGAARSVPAG